MSAFRSPAHAPGLINHEVLIPDCGKFPLANATKPTEQQKKKKKNKKPSKLRRRKKIKPEAIAPDFKKK
ncbi:hypothetical protein, partial [Escherichia coli]|uniref:hypothetical protein n=1 Tax=Escherichia coli TaxID=562 RepID=UPI001BAED874